MSGILFTFKYATESVFTLSINSASFFKTLGLLCLVIHQPFSTAAHVVHANTFGNSLTSLLYSVRTDYLDGQPLD